MLESWKVENRKVGSSEVGKLGPKNGKLEGWKVRPNKIRKLESEAQKMEKSWKVSTEDSILAPVQILVHMISIQITVA